MFGTLKVPGHFWTLSAWTLLDPFWSSEHSKKRTFFGVRFFNEPATLDSETPQELTAHNQKTNESDRAEPVEGRI